MPFSPIFALTTYFTMSGATIMTTSSQQKEYHCEIAKVIYSLMKSIMFKAGKNIFGVFFIRFS